MPITDGKSEVRLGGRGEVIEWAVKMERLPDDATLAERFRRGEVGVGHMDTLARQIAAFHARAKAGPAVAACGHFAVVAGNARRTSTNRPPTLARRSAGPFSSGCGN